MAKSKASKQLRRTLVQRSVPVTRQLRVDPVVINPAYLPDFSNLSPLMQGIFMLSIMGLVNGQHLPQPQHMSDSQPTADSTPETDRAMGGPANSTAIQVAEMPGVDVPQTEVVVTPALDRTPPSEKQTGKNARKKQARQQQLVMTEPEIIKPLRDSNPEREYHKFVREQVSYKEQKYNPEHRDRLLAVWQRYITSTDSIYTLTELSNLVEKMQDQVYSKEIILDVIESYFAAIKMPWSASIEHAKGGYYQARSLLDIRSCAYVYLVCAQRTGQIERFNAMMQSDNPISRAIGLLPTNGYRLTHLHNVAREQDQSLHLPSPTTMAEVRQYFNEVSLLSKYDLYLLDFFINSDTISLNEKRALVVERINTLRPTSPGDAQLLQVLYTTLAELAVEAGDYDAAHKIDNIVLFDPELAYYVGLHTDEWNYRAFGRDSCPYYELSGSLIYRKGSEDMRRDFVAERLWREMNYFMMNSNVDAVLTTWEQALERRAFNLKHNFAEVEHRLGEDLSKYGAHNTLPRADEYDARLLKLIDFLLAQGGQEQAIADIIENYPQTQYPQNIGGPLWQRFAEVYFQMASTLESTAEQATYLERAVYYDKANPVYQESFSWAEWRVNSTVGALYDGAARFVQSLGIWQSAPQAANDGEAPTRADESTSNSPSQTAGW